MAALRANVRSAKGRNRMNLNDQQKPPRIPATILAAAGLLLTGYFVRRLQANHRLDERVAPGPSGMAAARMFLPGGPDRITLFRRLHRRYGDVVRFSIGGRPVHLICDPQAVKYVFQDNNHNYQKGRGLVKARELLGDGLLTSEGEFWRRQRRLIQPVFHRRKIATFAEKMTAATEAMLNRWEPRADSGEPFDVAEEMMRLTLDIVSKTLFSTALSEREFETVSEVMRPLLQYTARRITSPFDFLDKWPTPANIRQKQYQERLNEIVYRMIAERRKSGVAHDDLLGMLMDATDEQTGARMDDAQLRDEVMTIFLAGHETTANLLSFLWMLLSQHANVRRDLYLEVDEVLNGRRPVVGDVANLKLVNLVIDETLRLYPPAWIIGRQAIEADEINGFDIPAGSGVLISPFILHRHPAHWTNPEGFDPWRFSDENAAHRLRYLFVPFGGGPRLCIGNNFALTEAALIVGMVSQRYELNLAPGFRVELDPAFTLRPRDGVWMTLHRRRRDNSGHDYA